jgi:hypothetical protein
MFRVISSASIGENVCETLSEFKNVAHIYIFCKYLPFGEALKLKYNKIKAVSNTIDDFINKL